MLIPQELLEKYNISTDIYGADEVIYQFFLINTDYICNKIVEGIATWDDYADEKKYRQVAREEISKAGENNDEDNN